MQTRFVSLRVTETWEMVEGRNPIAMPSAGPLSAPGAGPRTAPPQPHRIDPGTALKLSPQR